MRPRFENHPRILDASCNKFKSDIDKYRHDQIQLLGKMMSDLSEKCWRAGWIGDCEHLVPELCRRAVFQRRNQRWGGSDVSVDEARQLMKIAKYLGHWADTNYSTYMPFYPFPFSDDDLEIIYY